MAADRADTQPMALRSMTVNVLAAIGIVVAATTAHLSPVPAISATIVMAGSALLALRMSHRTAVATGLTLASAAATTVGLALGGTGLTVIGTGLHVAVSCMLAAEVVRRIGLARPGQPRTRPLDDRHAVEPALLELAKSTLGQRSVADVESSMEALIDALDCDMITIWENEANDGALTAEIRCRAGDRPGGGATISWSRAPGTAGTFSTGRSHVFADVNQLPNPDRSGYRRLGVTAAIEFPITVGGEWVGHVSLACTAGTRTWEPHEIDVVSTVAEIVGSVWDRRATIEHTERVIAQRDRSLAIQRAITEAARLVFESDEEEFAGVLKLVLGSLGGDMTYIVDVRVHDKHGAGIVPVASILAPGASIPKHLRDDAWVTLPSVYAPVLKAEPVIIGDHRDLPDELRSWYATTMPTVEAEMAFPIVSNDEVVGMIGMAASSPREWDAAQMRTLSTIASMIGVARTRAAARRGLEEIVKAKDSFIASVSHELRTPMAVVMGLSTELNTSWSDFSQAEVAEFIDLITRESRQVSHIIEDLLVAARTNAASITVLPELIRLDEVVAEAIASMAPEMSFQITSTELAPVSTLADPVRVRQIVRNLVANGHRHGGAHIFIRVCERDGSAMLEVADDGPGIPPDRRDDIFDAYEVGESGGRTASLGLGLTVSRQLARLMHGDVTYDPDPIPTFRLVLPVGAVRPRAPYLRAIAS